MFAHLLNNTALYLFDYHSISLSKPCFAKASDVSAIYEKIKKTFLWVKDADLQQPVNFIHFSFVCGQSDISPWLRSCGLPSMIFNWETFPLWQRNHSVPSRWRNPSAQVSEAFKQSKVKFTFCDCLLNINSTRCCLRIWHEQGNRVILSLSTQSGGRLWSRGSLLCTLRGNPNLMHTSMKAVSYRWSWWKQQKSLCRRQRLGSLSLLSAAKKEMALLSFGSTCSLLGRWWCLSNSS